MEDYLHTKGYLDASVSSHYKVKGRKVSAIYNVKADTLYTIDTINYVKGEKVVTALLMESAKNSVLKIGSPLDFEKWRKNENELKRYAELGHVSF